MSNMIKNLGISIIFFYIIINFFNIFDEDILLIFTFMIVFSIIYSKIYKSIIYIFDTENNNFINKILYNIINIEKNIKNSKKSILLEYYKHNNSYNNIILNKVCDFSKNEIYKNNITIKKFYQSFYNQIEINTVQNYFNTENCNNIKNNNFKHFSQNIFKQTNVIKDTSLDYIIKNFSISDFDSKTFKTIISILATYIQDNEYITDVKNLFKLFVNWLIV